MKSPEPVISVGILSGERVECTFSGTFTVLGTGAAFTGGCSAALSGDTIVIESGARRLEVLREARFEPADRECSFLLREVTIGIRFHWERKEDERFRGALKLLVADGGIAAINVVPVEDYLASVISSEMSAESSAPLLEAHAMTSRSWLLAQLDKSRSVKESGARYLSSRETAGERIRWYDREEHRFFDVCADDHCQRYQGITRASTPAVQQAIDATRGCVILHEGEICDARFSKSCGGVTETFENAWEAVRHPYLASVVDAPRAPGGLSVDFSSEANAAAWIRSSPEAFCNTRDRGILSQVLVNYDQETTDFYRWRVEYRQEELAELICRKSGIDFGDIVNLVPVERGKSARLVRLRIVGTRSSLTIGKDLEIRKTLSPTHLYSSAIVVDRAGGRNGVPERFTLTGAGWGHGVGLCQIGAAVMGERGYAAADILRHYFSDIQIQKIY